MAGKGNVPGESKTKSTNTTITFNLIASSESSVAGDTNLLLTSQDKIYGSSASQSINSGDSGDWIYTSGGADTVDGGAGTDWLRFEGYAAINSHAGSDYYANDGVVVNLGSDWSWTNQNGAKRVVEGYRFYKQGSDEIGSVINVENIFGSIANDILSGSEFDNEIYGGGANDLIYGGDGGRDLLFGGEGNDVMVGAKSVRTKGTSTNTSYNGGTGNDWMQSSIGNDVIDGNDPSESEAREAKSTFNNGNNDCDPDVNLDAGYSYLSQGDSLDYGYLSAGWTVTITLNGSSYVDVTVRDASGRVRERDKVRNVENLIGGAGSDPVNGDNNGNVLDGGGGDDIVKAGGGDDLILGGGGGNDNIDGGDGTDELSFVPVIDPVVNQERYSPANNKLNDNKSLVLDLRLDNGAGRYSYNTVETSATTNQPTSQLIGVAQIGITSTDDVDDPWRGAMTSIENVVGSAKNDQIAGTAAVNVLNGYDGNDLLYGAGGNDTIRGGDGEHDWILFRDATPGNQPRYTDNTLNIDPVRNQYDDSNDPYGLGGTIRLDTGVFTFASIAGVVSSTEHVLGSLGKDRVVGDANANILVGEGEEDTIYGGAGADRLFGAQVGTAESVGTGLGAWRGDVNSLWGGADEDLFFVGYNYNPVVGTALIVDHDGNPITTGVVNTAGALSTQTDVTDYGILSIEGSGKNFHDSINDWQTGDTIFLNKDWTVVIDGLGASNGSAYSERFIPDTGSGTAYDWSGADVVDLSSISGASGSGSNLNKLASDQGKIVVVTEEGDDSITGSNGTDWIYSGEGRSSIDLGDVAASGANGDGADRVYITDWSAQYGITGFDSDDKIYIDGAMLSSFFGAALGSRYIGPTDASIGAGVADVTALGINTNGLILDTRGAASSILAGQKISDGFNPDFINPIAELVWQSSYDSTLQIWSGITPLNPDYTPGPPTIDGPIPTSWSSNGAWTNDAHEWSRIFGITSLSLLAYGFYGVGVGVSFIPFVGPLLAIPFFVLAGTTIADTVLNTKAHLNGEYAISDLSDNTINDYVTYFDSGQDVGSTSWETRLLDFYSLPTDRFVRTLEVTSQGNNSIGTVVTVYSASKDETLIYLVYSADGMIQDNETRLIGRVNGVLSADQIVIYDPETDPYLGNASTPPVFPPNITAIDIETNEDTTVTDQGVTDDATPDIVISFDKALADDDTVTLTIGSTEIDITADAKAASGLAGNGPFSYPYTPEEPGLADGTYAISVSVVNAKGLETNGYGSVSIDSLPPVEAEVTVSSTAQALVVTTTEAGDYTYNLFDENENPLGSTEDAVATGSPFLVKAQASVVTASIGITDVFGRITYLTEPKVVLGTIGDDTLDGAAGVQNYLYGFDGEDSLRAGDQGDALYGGIGNDSLIGGTGDDILNGGSGADQLDLSSGGADRIDLLAVTGSNSDSGPGASDTVTGFSADDLITISASEITTFATSADTTRTAAVISVDLNANGSADTGDVELTFDSSADATTAASRIAYVLTGTAGNNTISSGDLDDRLDGGAGNDSLNGGAGNDWLKGGAGQDTLIGDTGDDTFAFGVGDSTDNTSTCDAITGLATGDKIDLSAIDFNYNFNQGDFSGGTAQTSGMTFTNLFDSFVYQDTDTNQYYFVWETDAGTGATAGTLEVVEIGAAVPGTLSSWSEEYGVFTVA